MRTLIEYGIKYFSYEEILHPDVTRQYPVPRGIHFMDIRIIRAWDWIRSQRGNPIYVNTYGFETPDWYPKMENRGLRIPTWAILQTSQHYHGRAIDGDEVGIDNKELYDFCMNHQEKLLSFGVTTIENIEYTPTWVHLDTRFWHPNQRKLKVVNPKRTSN